MKRKNSKDELRKRAEAFNWSRADALTDEEVLEAANADPDAKPTSKEWFERAAKRRARRKTAAE